MIERLQEVINQEFTAPDNKKSIFHYTNEQTYVEICRSVHLRINSHLFLNKKDKTNNELQIAKQLIIDQLRKHNVLKSQLVKFNEYINNKLIIYTLSLTHENSTKITKYGNFCLEFSSNLFHQFANTERSTMFGNVIYESQIQQKIIKKMFEIFDQFQQKDREATENLFLYLTMIIPLFKPKKHSADKECRIIQTEIFSPEKDGKLVTSLTLKKIPFALREILNVYKQPKESSCKIITWTKITPFL